MSPERGGEETGEQLHSILAAELSRRWRWLERERQREGDSNQILHDKVRTWYDSLGARGRDMSRLRAIRNKRGGLEARGRGRGTYYHDVSIVPEDRKLIGRFVILYRRWLVSWLDYLQPRFPVYIWRTNLDPTTRRRLARSGLFSSFLLFFLASFPSRVLFERRLVTNKAGVK